MSTMAIKSAVTMDHVKSGKKADFVSRFKKYMEDNVAYFAAGSAMMTGNGYAAGQIIDNVGILNNYDKVKLYDLLISNKNSVIRK